MRKVTGTFKQGPSTSFYLYFDGNWCSSAEKYCDLQAAFKAPKCKMLVKIHNNNYLRYFLFFGGGNTFFLSFSIFYFDKQIFPFRLSMQICVCTFKSLFFTIFALQELIFCFRSVKALVYFSSALQPIFVQHQIKNKIVLPGWKVEASTTYHARLAVWFVIN